MSAKRRDSKNRILRNGESQRSDGRYAYVYVDSNVKQKFLYSWKLENTDRIPQGKRDCISLREKIKNLKKDLDDGIVSNNSKLTVLQLVEKYTEQKKGVRLGTKSIYRYVVQILSNDSFGSKSIDNVKLSDAKEWFVKLQANGKSYGTIHGIRGVIKPAIYILFNTGLRISEFAGLTISDIDFENHKIKVDHQLLRRKDEHRMKVIIERTKTDSGVRYIPMTNEVSQCFKRIIENRKKFADEPVIDGLQGFLFLSKNGIPLDATRWHGYFYNICRKYNSTHEKPMPKVTPHICRHTFCSKMAKNGMNPKTLQYIMGHSNIGITLNTYAHVQYKDAEKEMIRLCKGN